MAVGTTGTYEVATPVYDGPFELLLHLILREEVDLYEVSLLDIVDAYLAEFERMEHCDLDTATEFLLIASTLVELKSRRLLPVDDDVELDDELALWEERDLLLSRLLECKTFKDAAVVLRRLHSDGARTYPRLAGIEERFVSLAPDLLAGVDADDVRRAYVKVLTRPQPRVDLFHVAAIKVNVADAVEELVDELPRLGRTTFRSLTSSLVERLEVVVRFLGLLELFKVGLVELDQVGQFGDIHIVWLGPADDAATAGEVLESIDDYEG
ncbi:MAG TPA: segregation/condensation protein A [Acidimicrobiales bacterium]